MARARSVCREFAKQVTVKSIPIAKVVRFAKATCVLPVQMTKNVALEDSVNRVLVFLVFVEKIRIARKV